MNRRSLLVGLSGLIAAPAVLRLGAHMPVRRVEDLYVLRLSDGDRLYGQTIIAPWSVEIDGVAVCIARCDFYGHGLGTPAIRVTDRSSGIITENRFVAAAASMPLVA